MGKGGTRTTTRCDRRSVSRIWLHSSLDLSHFDFFGQPAFSTNPLYPILSHTLKYFRRQRPTKTDTPKQYQQPHTSPRRFSFPPHSQTILLLSLPTASPLAPLSTASCPHQRRLAITPCHCNYASLPSPPLSVYSMSTLAPVALAALRVQNLQRSRAPLLASPSTVPPRAAGAPPTKRMPFYGKSPPP